MSDTLRLNAMASSTIVSDVDGVEQQSLAAGDAVVLQAGSRTSPVLGYASHRCNDEDRVVVVLRRRAICLAKGHCGVHRRRDGRCLDSTDGH